MGIAIALGTMSWKEAQLVCRRDIDNPICLKVLKKEIEGATSMNEHSVELNVFYDGADYQRIPPRLWYKVWEVTAVKGKDDLRPSMYSRVAGPTPRTSRSMSFCFVLGSYASGPPKI
jgi:hypothetical protein